MAKNQNTSSISRRDFLAGLVALGLLGRYQLDGMAANASAQVDAAVAAGRSILVIQLNGGNDGINTIIPYSNGAYYDARPKIAIKQTDVLKIDDHVGFHPALSEFAQFYNDRKLSLIHI